MSDAIIRCKHCGKKINGEPAVWRYRLTLLPNRSQPAPPKPHGIQWDRYDLLFHPECKGEWLTEHARALNEADRCMNSCRYFERLNGMDGAYVREGQRFPTSGELVEFGENSGELGNFGEWLQRFGWRDSWYAPRWEPLPLNVVRAHDLYETMMSVSFTGAMAQKTIQRSPIGWLEQ